MKLQSGLAAVVTGGASGLGEATARGASDCVSCPVSRAHSNLCFRTLDNDSVWHAFAPCSGAASR